MNAQPALHPTDQTLQSYGLGKLDDASAESVSQHLESCTDCRGRVAAMSSDSFLGKLRDAQGRPQSTSPPVSSLTGMSLTDAGASPTSPPPASTLPPGLADHPDYQVLRELGRGGMGVVYLAENKLMGRKEVLKVVGSHLISRPGVLERFQREIRSAAKLQHPNIVAAYSALRLGGSLVLSMEYVEGFDLARMVKAKGPLPVAHACNFIHQAALGLQHAHVRGMVHRDIKPANLMVSRDGKKPIVKVLDFGLAKVTSEGQADGGLTREGQMLGTPDYIAPEQIRDAQSADVRADIYSLGCTFYYLLSGGPPFGGDNLWDLYQAHFSMDAGPLNFVRPEVPVELAALVGKMMAKEPGKRFQIPGEVAQALTSFFKTGSTPVKGASAVISKAEQSEANQLATDAISVSARQAMERGSVRESEARKPSPTAPGLILEGLIDVGENNPLLDTLLDRTLPEATAKPSQEDHRTWSTAIPKPSRLKLRHWWTAAGVLLFGLVVAWVAIIKIKTSNGVIVLENVPENAVVEVDGDRITVTTLVGEPIKIEISAGKHVVVVKRGEDVLVGESVILESGKQLKLNARMASGRMGGSQKSDGSQAMGGMGTMGGMGGMTGGGQEAKYSPSMGMRRMMGGMGGGTEKVPGTVDAADSGNAPAVAGENTAAGDRRAKSDQRHPGMILEGDYITGSLQPDGSLGGNINSGQWKFIVRTINGTNFTGEYYWIDGTGKGDHAIQATHGTLDSDGNLKMFCDENLKGNGVSGWVLEGQLNREGQFRGLYKRSNRRGEWTGAISDTEKVQEPSIRSGTVKVPGIVDATSEGAQIHEGSTWRGWGHYVEPANFRPDLKFTMELTVTKRDGEQIKGTYKFNGKNEWEVEGTVESNIVRFEGIKVIKGGPSADVAFVFEGKIRGDRIDIECRHLTPGGEPVRAIGYFERDKD